MSAACHHYPRYRYAGEEGKHYGQGVRPGRDMVKEKHRNLSNTKVQQRHAKIIKYKPAVKVRNDPKNEQRKEANSKNR